MSSRRQEEEETEENEEEEEESGVVVQAINNLTIEMAGTEEEAADGLEAALGMEVEEDRDSEGRNRLKGLKGHWDTLSYSLRIKIQAGQRSLMPVMGSMS